MEAFYVSVPSYLPDDFAVCDSREGLVVFIWLVPISRSEADWIDGHGWDPFETLLEKHDTDLCNLYRAPIVPARG